MKFLIEQQVLDDALKTVQFALLTRPSLPVLNNVHIQAIDDKVIFTLTDQEITISCTAAADISTEGSTTLPMRKIISIVRRLPSQPVSFTLGTEEFTEILCQEICFKIQGVTTDDFPEVFTESYETSIPVSKESVRKLVINTSFATGNDSSRPIISGPLLKFEANKFTCVATDGKRLALESGKTNSEFEGLCVIPPKTTNALMKLMAGEGDVVVSFNEKSVQFEFNNEFNQATLINSKLIEGKFPRYEAIIPNGQENVAVINRQELAECLKRIALILSETSQGVKLKFSSNFLKMHASTQDDESNEEMEVEYEGPEQTIAFNPAYLIDPLKRLENDTVTLHFTDSQKAASLKSGESFIYVLMPMRM